MGIHNFSSSASGNFDVTYKNYEKLTKMTLLNVEILQNKMQKKDTDVFKYLNGFAKLLLIFIFIRVYQKHFFLFLINLNKYKEEKN